MNQTPKQQQGASSAPNESSEKGSRLFLIAGAVLLAAIVGLVAINSFGVFGTTETPQEKEVLPTEENKSTETAETKSDAAPTTTETTTTETPAETTTTTTTPADPPNQDEPPKD